MQINKKFWKNKRVLITGHTGFKGGWLSVLLNQLKSKVSVLHLIHLERIIFLIQ